MKKWVQIASYLLGAFAIIYVVNAFWSQRTILLSFLSFRETFRILALGGIAYTLANIFLAVAWIVLLDCLGEKNIHKKTIISIYGKTQILKYIPGNLLSLPGRFILSAQAGIQKSSLIVASIYEIIGLLMGSSLIMSIGLLITNDKNLNALFPLSNLILLISIFSPLILSTLFLHFNFFKKFQVLRAFSRPKQRELLIPGTLYTSFFIFSGAIFSSVLLFILKEKSAIPFALAISIFSISWLVGFVTPGAPGGIGVRESLIIIMLTNYIDQPSSILIALLMRGVTIIGDILFYFISLLLEITQRYHAR
jgi:glycosyltransferase 2 family protein